MTIYDCQLRHGPDGRIVEKIETVNGKAMTWTYCYDKDGRLTGAQFDGRTVCDINYDREGYRVSDYFPHLDTHYRNYSYSVMDDRLQQAGHKSAGQRIWTLPSSATPRRGEGHGWPESTMGTPTTKTDSGPSGTRAASTRSTSTRRTTGS